MGTSRELTDSQWREIAALKADLLERDRLLAQRDVLLQKRDELVAKLEHQVATLTKLVFGPRSERQIVDLSLAAAGRQPFLFLQEIALAAKKLAEEKEVRATVTLVSEEKPAPRHGRRKLFPAHLPQVTTELELEPPQRMCCGVEMKRIGEEASKTLERVETFVVHQVVRFKYACQVCHEQVKVAPGPDRVIDKGLLSTGALAHVITERFGNHLPYHRLEKKYAAEGIELSRSVLCRASLACAEILAPIVKQMAQEMRSSFLVQMDDTPVVLQESSRGGRKTANFWIYRDLEENHVYDFTESRSRDGPLSMLGEREGFVQADAYSAHDVLFGPETKMLEVGCMAHARRYFKKALDSEKGLAQAALDTIGRLYLVERTAKERELDPEGVLRMRQEHAVPELDRFKTWLEVTRTEVLDKGPMATAIDYALSNWIALTRYVIDGRIPIDNNGAERALRAVAVGRKNWMQIGNVRGGQGAAVLYSLVQTCKAIGVDPRTYVRDVLERIAKESDVEKLTPHGWKKHFAAEVAAQRDSILARLAAAN
jgi:transposase